MVTLKSAHIACTTVYAPNGVHVAGLACKLAKCVEGFAQSCFIVAKSIFTVDHNYVSFLLQNDINVNIEQGS